ncbi:MAG: glycosyltransferase family 4 protein [Planctomycetaceae bacterium]
MSILVEDSAGRQLDLLTDVQPRTKPMKLAYIVSRFPKPTETFILSELEALRARDVRVEVFSLLDKQHATNRGGSSLRQKFVDLVRPAKVDPPQHADAVRWQSRAHYSPLFSLQVLLSQFAFLIRHPIRYTRALVSLIARCSGSLRYLSSGLLLFPRIVLIARQLQQMRVTHIHAHFANNPAAAAFIIHRLTELPYSFTAHGSDLHRDHHMLKQKVRDAAFVVCISEFNRDWALRRSDISFEDKVKVIHCGVDTQTFKPRTGQPSEFTRVLQIGTLHEVKGQSILLEACAELKRQDVRVDCHFVGSGPDRDLLEQLAKSLEITDRVIFHGYQTPRDIRSHLANADILACPSVESSDGRREGIPVVLMEAMASGVPVIASSLSGIPELVDNEVEGLLFKPGSSRELANGLRFLSENPTKAQDFAEAARTKVLQEFDRDQNIEALIDLFEETTTC